MPERRVVANVGMCSAISVLELARSIARLCGNRSQIVHAEARSGEIFSQIQAVFPDQKPINRTTINSWEDRRVVDAVAKTGRKKLVIAALWTEMCLAQPAIHAMGDGYDVYAVTDASGGASAEAHEMAILRLVAAGAQPITWLGMAGELQRDWARTERLGELAQVLFDHAGASGTILAWELANEQKGKRQ